VGPFILQKERALVQVFWHGSSGVLMRADPASLSEGEVHVWCLSLDRPPEETALFFSLLSGDERARAERFSFEEHRDQFAVGRGLLRDLLSGYLGEAPSRIAFAYGPQGKPALAGAKGGRSVEFNLSHSGDMAVYAFSRGRRLGIDVERVRPMPDENHFADRFFSPAESSLVRSLSGGRKLAAFFTIWTCKEAILKASGDGLARHLNQTEVLLSEGRPVQLTRVDGDSDRAALWRLKTFAPVPGYRAALAAEGQDWEFVPQTEGEFDETKW
jgi:4'-phosphopantetheinyl transferase